MDEERRRLIERKVTGLGRVFTLAQRDEHHGRRIGLVGGALPGAAVEPVEEGAQTIERSAVGVVVQRIAAELIADEEEAGHGFLEIARLETNDVALIGGRPPGPGAGKAVGLRSGER